MTGDNPQYREHASAGALPVKPRLRLSCGSCDPRRCACPISREDAGANGLQEIEPLVRWHMWYLPMTKPVATPGRRTAKPPRRNCGHRSGVRGMSGSTGRRRSGVRARLFPPGNTGARFGGDAYGPTISRGRRRTWSSSNDAAAIRRFSRCAESLCAKDRSPWPSNGSTNRRRRSVSY